MMPPKSNYYADAEPPQDQSGPPDKDTSQEKEDAGDAQTAEIPKGVLGGKDFKPGEEVVMRVVQVMEDSVLVKYASGEKEEEEAPPEQAPAEAPPPAAGGPMSGMLS